jgi:hypothetical protein
VPNSTLAVADEIISIADSFCSAHLNLEYAGVCRELVAKLARKRPSPLLRGQPRIWAAGVIYAVGQVNFLFDPSQRPHLRADQLAELIDVKQTTMANKAGWIRHALGLTPLDIEYCLPSRLDDNPLAWLIEINGIIVDARAMPAPIQAEAHRRGLIPHMVEPSAR